MNRQTTPQAVQDCHNLLEWIIPKLDKFPRLRRYTLGERIENELLDVLDALLEASYSRQKADALARANQRLDLARHLWRLSERLNAVSTKSWQHGAKLMVELGQQIGGWRRGQGVVMALSLWEKLVSFENLFAAWNRAKKGKSRRPDVAEFAFRLEENLLLIQQQLLKFSYQPGEYRQFNIYDKKQRLISAAPFKDRVVHHALMRIVESLFENDQYTHSYACRNGKGVHRAVANYQDWSRRYRYVLQLDIRAYFHSIDHTILKQKIREVIDDNGVLWLFNRLIDTGPPTGYSPPLLPTEDLVTRMQRCMGLPLGNLTSQHLGNLYLTALDRDICKLIPDGRYLRYVDDLTLLHNNKSQLWYARDVIQEHLQQIMLELHPQKQTLTPTQKGINLLGYRVFPNRIRLVRDNGYRYRRRLRKLAHDYAQYRIELEDVRSSVAAWLGHVKFADAKGLQKAILNEVSFTRGCKPTRVPSSLARRGLEQQTDQPAICEP